MQLFIFLFIFQCIQSQLSPWISSYAPQVIFSHAEQASNPGNGSITVDISILLVPPNAKNTSSWTSLNWNQTNPVVFPSTMPTFYKPSNWSSPSCTRIANNAFNCHTSISILNYCQVPANASAVPITQSNGNYTLYLQACEASPCTSTTPISATFDLPAGNILCQESSFTVHAQWDNVYNQFSIHPTLLSNSQWNASLTKYTGPITLGTNYTLSGTMNSPFDLKSIIFSSVLFHTSNAVGQRVALEFTNSNSSFYNPIAASFAYFMFSTNSTFKTWALSFSPSVFTPALEAQGLNASHFFYDYRNFSTGSSMIQGWTLDISFRLEYMNLLQSKRKRSICQPVPRWIQNQNSTHALPHNISHSLDSSHLNQNVSHSLDLDNSTRLNSHSLDLDNSTRSLDTQEITNHTFIHPDLSIYFVMQPFSDKSIKRFQRIQKSDTSKQASFLFLLCVIFNIL